MRGRASPSLAFFAEHLALRLTASSRKSSLVRSVNEADVALIVTSTHTAPLFAFRSNV